MSGAWLGALLLVPWLNPYTHGPTPNAWPWLVSALCAVFLWLGRRELTAERLAAGWLAAALISALMALVQYFGLAALFSPWINQPRLGEAYANLRQRNQFATLTSIGLVALIGWLALREKRANSLSASCASAASSASSAPPTAAGPLPFWAYGAALLLALANAASSSRTGLLQWLLIAALTAWWARTGGRRWRVFVLQTLLAYGVAILLMPVLFELVTGQTASSALRRLAEGDSLCSSRLTLWSNVLTLIAQKPWLGWGWGELDYAHFITLYPGPRFCEILDNAHNLPLHLAVELGLPAAVLMCGAVIWVVWRARPWRETHPARQMAWAVLAVIALHSLVEYPLWYGPFQIAVALSVALLCWPIAQSMDDNGIKVSNTAVTPYLQALAAIIMIVILVSVAISYHRVSQIYLLPDERSAAYRDNTLEKIRDSWLFPKQAQFAEFSITPLTPQTAAEIHVMALDLLHYSPEPKVVQKLIESATMLNRDTEAVQYLARYRAAFPADYARWVQKNAPP